MVDGEKDEIEERYRIVNLSEDEYEAFDKSSVVGVRRERYGVSVMVDTYADGKPDEGERADIEDLIIYISGGEEK